MPDHNQDFHPFLQIMTLDEFKATITDSIPPHTATEFLQALWFDAKDDWHRAHDIVQDINTPEGSWIHAYLHRKEGDLGNASYWYHRANRNIPSISLEEEWEDIVSELL